MDKDFSSCSEPNEVFDELLSELASGYVITEPEGNTFELLKGKAGLTPVQKKEAKNPAQLFEILQRKGILKSPNVGQLEKYFTDIDQRAIPLIKKAETRIKQLLGNKDRSTFNGRKCDDLRNSEEDIGKILNETIEGMEEDDHADVTSKELKSALRKLRSKYLDSEERLHRSYGPYTLYGPYTINGPYTITTIHRTYTLYTINTLWEYDRNTRDTYQICRDEVESRIQKADQQPRATVFLRQTLHEDTNLGFGNENSTDASEMLDDLEREGKIGPQKYSYFSKIMNKIDPRLMEIVARAQRKLRELQKVLLRHLKNMMKELEGSKELEQCSHFGKRRREDEEEDRSHKRQEVNGY